MSTSPAANARNSINAQVTRLAACLEYLQKNLGRFRALNDAIGGTQERGGTGDKIPDRPAPSDHLSRLTEFITGLENTVRAIDDELSLLNANVGGAIQPAGLTGGRASI